tara:strand:- start:335 stop:517 length:183 start_codon:yes stop_codon:yes gene_type:complete
MPFGHEPQKFCTGGVSEQRRNEGKRATGLPTAPVNAWKVALGHALTGLAKERRASNLSVD